MQKHTDVKETDIKEPVKTGVKFEKFKGAPAKESGTEKADPGESTEGLGSSGSREFSPPSTKPEIDTGRYSQSNEESPNEQGDLGGAEQRLPVNPRMTDANVNSANPN